MPDQPQDRVQQASRKKDGTPDQTDDYVIIGDKEAAIAATAEQLGQAAVSAADQANPVAAPNPDEVVGMTAEEQARKDEYDALVEQARATAEAEVEARWVDPRARQAEVETAVKRSSSKATATE